MSNLLASVKFQLEFDNQDFKVAVGYNSSDVIKLVQAEYVIWKPMLSKTTPSVSCSPYAGCCVGIKYSDNYKITLSVRAVDMWICVEIFILLSIFVFSEELSQVTEIHYVLACVLGCVLIPVFSSPSATSFSRKLQLLFSRLQLNIF